MFPPLLKVISCAKSDLLKHYLKNQLNHLPDHPTPYRTNSLGSYNTRLCAG